MIALTPHMTIWVALGSLDFRCGIDALSEVVKTKLRSDPFSGQVFVFCNRKKTAVKILVYDQQGFWLMMKRLSRGSFRHWPEASIGINQKAFTHLELSVLLFNGSPEKIEAQGSWRPYGPLQRPDLHPD